MIERSEFRCVACGAIGTIEAPSGTLTLGFKARDIDASAPSCPCGHKSWVLRGSMTEFYRYTNRPDVCRIGDHPASSLASYELVPRGAVGATVTLEVRVCPEHVAHLLAHGMCGFFVRESNSV